LTEAALTKRWTPLRYHDQQARLWTDPHRFKVCWAGRRSGKTERAKRKGIEVALRAPPDIDDFRVAFVAPVFRQAKDIYWNDLQLLIPREFISSVSISELTISLVTGAKIQVMGMNNPAPIEGSPLDWIGYDEAGNMPTDAFWKHVYPSLDTPGRPGEAWIYGVPRPGGGFREIARKAQDPTNNDWGAYTWPSSDIVPAEQIDVARAAMDARLFAQEYEASFVNFGGRIYYPFTRETHACERLFYEPDRPLIFALDFNVEPGVAVVMQEQTYHGNRPEVAERITAGIGEVFIPNDSNTPMVCRTLGENWGHHEGYVYLYGDPSGGARHTSQTEGTDWDLAYNVLSRTFGERLRLMRGRDRNPAQRARCNAVNSRLESADGVIHALFDPNACPELVKDFEEVVCKEGTNGEIDKDPAKFKYRTHLSDGLAYYMHEQYPVDEQPAFVDEPLLM